MTFADRIIEWQARHGRNDLPWQGTRDPYRIWLAEIMLQQTQVGTVIPYYLRFLERFPDVHRLAAADADDVMRLWSGLGYYSRARNLHAAAQAIVARHGGRFPRALAEVEALPGIGRSTAAAIAGFAFGARAAILDGNVKRVFARHFGVDGYTGERSVEQALWRLAESLTPPTGIERYIQGLMDLGATLCTTRQPACSRCPVRETCVALAANRVGELPAPRPRKTVPMRETAMLLLRHQGGVLLQKRPPLGIWGGLWSLPELALADDPVRVAAERFGCAIALTERLGVLKHGFTHFTLRITPVVAHVASIAPRAAQPGCVWSSLEEARGAALPVPVKKLLARLAPSALAQQAALFQEAVEDL